MKTYTAWKQYEFEIEANSLDEAYDKLRNLDNSQSIEFEYWVDDKDEDE